MSLSIPFFIPDTSPIYSYSTCTTCNASTRQHWQSAYSPRGDGYDVTFHQTERADAVVEFVTTALTIDVHSSLDGSCSATYSVDGGSFNPGCSISLDGQKHGVAIRPQAGSSVFEFFGISGTSKLASDRSYVNQTFDDTSSLFTYTSNDWTHVMPGGAVGPIANQTVVHGYSTEVGKVFNSSASITTNRGGRVDIAFPSSAAAIYLFGSSDPNGGTAEIYLDNTLYSSLNFNNSAWKSYGSLLFLQTDFDTSQPGPSRNLCVISTTPGKQISIDYAVVSSFQEEKRTTANLPLIIGSIGGSSAFLLLIGVTLYLCISRRKARARARGQKVPYAFNYGIANAKISSIDNWRKKTVEAPSPERSSFSGSSGPSGRDPRENGSTTSSARRNGAGFGHPCGSPRGSPPPEYPDFVPYRGPIEPPPAAVVARPESSAEEYNWPTTQATLATPVHSSRDARVEGWVNNVHASSPRHSISAETYRSYRTARSDQSGRTAHTAKSGDRLRPKTPQSSSSRHSREVIPLSPYRHTDVLSSPVSELSSAGLGGMTTRAVRATGSVARVWQAEVPSTQYTQAGRPSPTASSPGRRDQVADSMQFAPSYTIAGNFITSADQLIGSRFNTPERNTYASSRPSSPHSTLRRGVSIKSVKTMRSFFSGLLWNGSHGSPVPETPALPNQIQAARPDSGIFPITRNNSVMVTPRAPVRRGRRKAVPTPQGTSDARTSDYPSTDGPSSYPFSFSPSPPSFLQSPPSALRIEGLGGIQGVGASPQLFIELNPNSPVTMFAPSRPGSQMTTYWR